MCVRWSAMWTQTRDERGTEGAGFVVRNPSYRRDETTKWRFEELFEVVLLDLH